MSQLFEVKVNLSEKQRIRLTYARNNGKTIVLRISENALNGNDVLFVLERTKLKLESERLSKRRGMDIKIFPNNDIILNEEGKVFLTYQLSNL